MIYIHHRTSVFFIILFSPHLMWSVFTPCGHMDLKDKIECPLASMSSEYNCQGLSVFKEKKTHAKKEEARLKILTSILVINNASSQCSMCIMVTTSSADLSLCLVQTQMLVGSISQQKFFPLHYATKAAGSEDNETG